MIKAIDVAHFQARVLQDALTQATADHWEHRAQTFDAVWGTPPLPLNAHPDWVSWAPEAVQTALACRRHAAILRDAAKDAEISAEVWDALEQVA